MATVTHSDNPPAANTRLLTMWAALAAVLLVALIGASLAYVHGSMVASCLNNVLATRNGPSQKDATAHLDWARAVQKAIDTAPGVTPAKAASIRAQLRTETSAYVEQLVADNVERNSHPLGAC